MKHIFLLNEDKLWTLTDKNLPRYTPINKNNLATSRLVIFNQIIT